MKIIHILLFSAIAAFPSIGTSTGVMRQKIMYKRNMPRNMHRNKISKNSRRPKIISTTQFLNSLNNAKIMADNINAANELQRLFSITRHYLNCI
jgi:hypothetical protein